jgi:ribonucleases P/MRP protein subunit RPP40
LTGLIDKWTANLDEKSGCHMHVISLDWAKAFDKVDHQRLLSKLEFYGISGIMLKWCESFLVGRTQFVKFNGSHSEPCEVPSGVIRSSILGPLLFFNLCVADLPEKLWTNFVQYVDESSLENLITCQADVDLLQQDLDDIFIWCENNGMEMNVGKCKAMDITRERTPL